MSQPQPVVVTGPDMSGRPFNEKFFELAVGISRAICEQIPELESLAIVPAWKVPQEHLPLGVIQNAAGPLKNPTEFYHMLQQLLGVLHTQVKGLEKAIQPYDLAAQELAAQITKRQEQIRELDAEYARRHRQVYPASVTG
jgi:hypothetical protein